MDIFIFCLCSSGMFGLKHRMTTMIMKDGKKRTVSKKKLNVSHKLSYECPYCNKPMVCSIQSVFTRCDYGYEIWICEGCKKEFRLCFQEIIELAGKSLVEKEE